MTTKTTTKIRTAVVAAGGAAAITGLAGLGAGSASAQPWERLEPGTYTATTHLPSVNPLDPGPGIPVGTVVLTDSTVSINGATGKIRRTPDADYAAGIAQVPGFGQVALLPDHLVIGGHENRPEYLTFIWLTPRR